MYFDNVFLRPTSIISGNISIWFQRKQSTRVRIAPLSGGNSLKNKSKYSEILLWTNSGPLVYALASD